MRIALYAHPFSSYCQKALIAFYENDIPFDFRMLGPEEQGNTEQFERLWPLKRFPLLVEGNSTVMEATIIIEYLHVHHPGRTPLIPADAEAAIEARMLDRFFDNYVATPQQKIVFDQLRPEQVRDPHGVAEARAMLDTAYAWLDARMTDREWAAGDFGVADCAAAPMLFYADWSHPIAGRFPNVTAYRRRLIARPSFARAIEEARPYRALFPGGAPDRD